MKLFSILTLSAVLSACVTPLAKAPADTLETSADQVFDLTKISCWELMTLPDEDATAAFTLFYGYEAGTKGQPLQKSEIVEKVIVATIDSCGHNPSTSALQMFDDNWDIK